MVAAGFVICLVAACSADTMTSTHAPGPPHSQTAVDVPFCSGVEPYWVAFQDGDGEWTRALPVVEGQKIRFRHTFTSDHGAIAAVRVFPGNRLTTLTVQYASPDELIIAADTAAIDCGLAATRTLLGTITGIDTNGFADVTAGYAAAALVAPSQPSFSLRGLGPGPQDILAKRVSRVNDASQVTKVILRRTPDLADGTLLPTFDFNSAEAFDPVLASATLAGVDLEGAIVTTSLRTAYSQSLLGAFAQPATGNRRTIVELPAERLRDGDLQSATASAVATADDRRSATIYFRAPNDQTLTFGAPATVPSFRTIATTPSLRVGAAFDAQADYDRLTSIMYQQNQTIVSVGMTSAYASVAPAGYDLIVPDLSQVAGFDSHWALRPNDAVFWTSARIGGSLGLGVNAQPVPGATSRSAVRFGTFSP